MNQNRIVTDKNISTLNSNIKVKRIQVGVNSWTPQTAGYFTQNITFDAKQIIGYKELTADNFMAVTCVILGGDNGYDVISQGLQFNNVPVCSYNANTGILNVKISYYVNRGIVSARTFAYCFYN